MAYREFKADRQRMNEKVLAEGTTQTKRFFSLDARAYLEGALSAKTKELLGLVASTVLRCNDCITYHLDQCIKLGCTDEELHETLDIALVVGGSITIPHVRHAYMMIEEIRAECKT